MSVCVLFIWLSPLTNVGCSNQSGGAIAATSTLSCCSMKVMRKHVVTKLSPHWKAVCHQLSYPPDNFTCGNNKKSVIAVLEKWISVAERGGQPKTWHMFGEEVLSNIDHCVSDAICADLKKNEGICIGECHHMLSVIALVDFCLKLRTVYYYLNYIKCYTWYVFVYVPWPGAVGFAECRS